GARLAGPVSGSMPVLIKMLSRKRPAEPAPRRETSLTSPRALPILTPDCLPPPSRKENPMNRRDLLKAGVAGVGLGLTRFPMAWAAGAESPKRHLLMYTRSQGFEHSVIKHGKNGELSLAERIVTALGARHGFEVTCTKDGSVFLPESIGKFD